MLGGRRLRVNAGAGDVCVYATLGHVISIGEYPPDAYTLMGSTTDRCENQVQIPMQVRPSAAFCCPRCVYCVSLGWAGLGCLCEASQGALPNVWWLAVALVTD